jgi:hypothetical protein
MGTGYDISASASTSSTATSGNVGAVNFGAGGSSGGGSNIALIGIIAGCGLLALIFFLKFRKKGRRR